MPVSDLLTVAMGGMQIMLDKGEENDWFASAFIRVFGLLFVAGTLLRLQNFKEEN
jgi:hypothetical protein